MIEFAMLLPISIFFLLFIFNIGSAVLVDNVLNDAVYTAAQLSAQTGAVDPNAVRAAIDQTMTNLGPGYSPANLTVTQAGVTNVAGFGNSNVCTSGVGGYTMVRVSASYNYPMIPGLGALINMIGGGGASFSSSLTLNSTGVARCEIARQ